MINPQQFRLLLAGPRVARLQPFLTGRGYLCDAAGDGQTALEHLRDTPRHLLLVELELGDMMLADLLVAVNEENLAGAVLLLDDPAKSGLIVSTLTRGIDAYVSTPPDETFLFRVIERQLLAQWALAQAGQLQADTQERARLEKQLNVERAKVTQLVKDLAGLRDELAQAQVQAANATAAAAEAAATAAAAVAAAPSSPAMRAAPRKGASLPTPPFAQVDDGAYQADVRTSPRGYQRGELEELLNDDSDLHQLARRTAPAGVQAPDVAALDFAPPPTGAGLGAELLEEPGADFEVKSESDLFLDLDGDAEDLEEEPTTAGLPPTAPGGLRAISQAATNSIADPFDDSLDD